MNFRPETSRLLADLQAFSGGRLTRSDDLGRLLELGRDSGGGVPFDELVFLAKFLSRIHGIMQRIGPDAQGYDKLLGEFNTNLARTRVLLQDLLAEAPPGVRSHFQSTYLDMSRGSLENYLALLSDLGWYKNWKLDHPGDNDRQ